MSARDTLCTCGHRYGVHRATLIAICLHRDGTEMCPCLNFTEDEPAPRKGNEHRQASERARAEKNRIRADRYAAGLADGCGAIESGVLPAPVDLTDPRIAEAAAADDGSGLLSIPDELPEPRPHDFPGNKRRWNHWPEGTWKCLAPGCGFLSPSRADAERHLAVARAAEAERAGDLRPLSEEVARLGLGLPGEQTHPMTDELPTVVGQATITTRPLSAELTAVYNGDPLGEVPAFAEGGRVGPAYPEGGNPFTTGWDLATGTGSFEQTYHLPANLPAPPRLVHRVSRPLRARIAAFPTDRHAGYPGSPTQGQPFVGGSFTNPSSGRTYVRCECTSETQCTPCADAVASVARPTVRVVADPTVMYPTKPTLMGRISQLMGWV